MIMYQSPDRDIWMEDAAVFVDQGEVVNSVVHFNPSARRIYEADISFWVIAPEEMFEIFYPVYGRGGGWPHIQINQRGINALVENPEPVELPLVIGNVGGWDLEFEIIVDQDIEWLDIAPLEGVIDPGDEMDIVMTFGEEMPDNGQYQTMITVESNDDDNPEIEIDIELNVEIRDLEPLVVELSRGWSLISTNREFPDEMIDEEGPDLQLIMAEIIDNLIIFKNGFGLFCIPAFDFWDIPFWAAPEAYLIKVSEDTELEFDGELIPFNRPIQLEQGWNYVAYYPDFVNELRFALGELIDADLLELAKNGNGEFIHPDFVMGMIETEPGEGFMIKVNADCEFQWPPAPDWIFSSRNSIDQLDHFPDPPLTDSNMSVVFHTIGGLDVNQGAEMACISPRDEISGVTIISGEAPWGMAVWGDDAITEEIEGFQEGEPLRFVYWDPESNWELEVHYDILNGMEPVYTHNGLLIMDTEVSVKEIETWQPLTHEIIDVYPNPFNDRTAMVYTLSTPDRVRIGLYDISGKLVSMLAEEYQSAGRHTMSISGSSLPDGIYFIRMMNRNQTLCQKILHLK